MCARGRCGGRERQRDRERNREKDLFDSGAVESQTATSAATVGGADPYSPKKSFAVFSWRAFKAKVGSELIIYLAP